MTARWLPQAGCGWHAISLHDANATDASCTITYVQNKSKAMMLHLDLRLTAQEFGTARIFRLTTRCVVFFPTQRTQRRGMPRAHHARRHRASSAVGRFTKSSSLSQPLCFRIRRTAPLRTAVTHGAVSSPSLRVPQQPWHRFADTLRSSALPLSQCDSHRTGRRGLFRWSGAAPRGQWPEARWSDASSRARWPPAGAATRSNRRRDDQRRRRE